MIWLKYGHDHGFFQNGSVAIWSPDSSGVASWVNFFSDGRSRSVKKHD